MSEQPDRRSYIGSSDAPAICGVDPYRTSGDVWTEKIRPQDAREVSIAMRIGLWNEPLLIDLTLEALGLKCDQAERDTRVYGDGSGSHCSAQLDAVTITGELIEAKVTGLAGYGDPAIPNDVPLATLVQTHFSFGLTKASVCHVPVLRARYGGVRFDLYRVERIDELAEEVLATCEEFWDRYVVPEIEPPGDGPRLSTLKRIVRQPDKVAVGGNDAQLAAERYEAVSAAYRELGKIREKAQAELLAHFEDAEGLSLPSGAMYTYLPITVPPKQVRGYTYRRLASPKSYQLETTR